MKNISLMCHLQVVPFTPEGMDGDEAEGKEFIFTDTDTGEIIHYKMAGKMAKRIGNKLKMTNKSLQSIIDKEQADANAEEQARAGNGPAHVQLLGPGGNPV